MKMPCIDSERNTQERPGCQQGRAQRPRGRRLRLRITAALAVAVFVCSGFTLSRGAAEADASRPTAEQAGEPAASDTASPFEWSFEEETKTLTVSGRGAMPDWGWDGAKAPWHKAALRAETIRIEDGIERIGAYAFWGAGEDGTGAVVYIPKSVKDVAPHALAGWITRIEADDENPVYSSLDGALYDKAGTTLLQMPGARRGRVLVPEGTAFIGDWAFEWCAYIREIELPDGVTAIGDHAFSNCKALSTLLLPEGVETVGNEIFRPEAMLFNRPVLSIPHSVQAIGENHFGRLPGMAGIDVYYAGTEEDWRAVEFAAPEGVTGDYTLFYMEERADDKSDGGPWADAAGRWASGQRSETTGYYEEELSIRFTGSDAFVFTWRKQDAGELTDLRATIDPKTGVASFDDQTGYQTNAARGTLRFQDGTLTLRIETSKQNEAVPDGYEVSFDTKESDRLQSANWFAALGA